MNAPGPAPQAPRCVVASGGRVSGNTRPPRISGTSRSAYSARRDFDKRSATATAASSHAAVPSTAAALGRPATPAAKAKQPNATADNSAAMKELADISGLIILPYGNLPKPSAEPHSPSEKTQASCLAGPGRMAVKARLRLQDQAARLSPLTANASGWTLSTDQQCLGKSVDRPLHFL
jgi:hypothetical protein